MREKWVPSTPSDFECQRRMNVILKYTVDLEIFVVRIFSWFAQTTKIKKHKIYFTTDNHYSKNIFVRNFTAHC